MDGTDLELLERARAGDRPSLDALLERYQRQVFRFGLQMCRDEEDAKDVVQETLLAMARSVRDFRGASSVSTWLYSIARSFCVKKRRRSKFAPALEQSLASAEVEAHAVADPARPQDEALAGREIQRALERAIASLDPMYREILVLRDVEGLTAPEVAEVTGLTVEAVKSRLHRARAQVRACVAPMLGVPEPDPERAGGCPDVIDLFSRHLEGDISSDVCAEMEAHLARCGRCTARCASLRQTLLLCGRNPAPEVPATVQRSVREALRQFLAEPRQR